MKRILLFALISFIVFSCKKYPEGPAISLLTKTHRVSHSWVTTQILEDGIDKTSSYQSAYKDYNLIIYKAGNYSVSYLAFGLLSYSESGNWAFNSEKTYINFDPSSNTNPSNPWKVIKLKNDEFWALDEDFNGKKLELHFIPK